jgi:SagB-type dehydrogenase family enzyme
MSNPKLNLNDREIRLPAPMPPVVTLGQSLQARRSSRTFAPKPLRSEEVSTLLWAAFGINRREGTGRTAPSAHNWQETDIYAVFANGAWRYEVTGHRLLCASEADLRAFTGEQDFVATAPLDLVYVADFSRMSGVQDDESRFLAAADAGCIAQNVYLCCAAMGLATVVRGLIDRKRLATALDLRPHQRVILAQTVGYPVA